MTWDAARGNWSVDWPHFGFPIVIEYDGMLWGWDDQNNRFDCVVPNFGKYTTNGLWHSGPAYIDGTAAQQFIRGFFFDAPFDTTYGVALRREPCDASIDTDGDELNDCREYDLGTAPNNPDTDGDGLTDGNEVDFYGTRPLKPDSDDDGLSDGDEIHTHRTNPNRPDSDGDDFSDGEEVAAGSNPNDPASTPDNPGGGGNQPTDSDGDGVEDGVDNCPDASNTDQADSDGDGTGDACDTTGGRLLVTGAYEYTGLLGTSQATASGSTTVAVTGPATALSRVAMVCVESTWKPVLESWDTTSFAFKWNGVEGPFDSAFVELIDRGTTRGLFSRKYFELAKYTDCEAGISASFGPWRNADGSRASVLTVVDQGLFKKITHTSTVWAELDDGTRLQVPLEDSSSTRRVYRVKAGPTSDTFTLN